jgi:hypothetical protein
MLLGLLEAISFSWKIDLMDNNNDDDNDEPVVDGSVVLAPSSLVVCSLSCLF